MKILFVTDRVNSKSDPNINLIKDILPFIEKDNSVYFMGHDTDEKMTDEFCFFFDRDERVRNLFFSLSELSLLGKIIKLITNPVLSFWGVFKVFNIDFIDRKYAETIEKLDKKYKFDAVISVSAPFYTAKGLAKRNIGGKKIIMMFDPYGYHYKMGNKRTKKQEKLCFEKADKIFVPALQKRLYTDSKIESFEFPAVITDKPSNICNLYDNKKINLAFVGSLYSDIRRPDYLFDIMKALADDRYHLTVVGGIYGNFGVDFYKKYDEVINKYVTIIGKVDRETARRYLWQADVLVNIGNKVDNMLPSKVLEYISTGKPVLNIMQIENCPSKEYFEKYKNALNINSNEPLTEDILKKIKVFLDNPSEISKTEIESTFFTATPKYVAKQILTAINE